MGDRPVFPRARATRDAQDAISYYMDQGAVGAALGFVDALERAYRHIGRHPASGSPRYAHELTLPELRCWPLKGYPWLVFYVDRPDRVDVWRILHAERDIPVSLSGSDPTPGDS